MEQWGGKRGTKSETFNYIPPWQAGKAVSLNNTSNKYLKNNTLDVECKAFTPLFSYYAGYNIYFDMFRGY